MPIVSDLKKLADSVDITRLTDKTARQDLNIVIFGAGVIGGSVGGWIAQNYDHVYLLDQGETANAMRENGLTLYCGDTPEKRERVQVNVISDLSELKQIDLIVVGVKNFSLEPVAKLIRKKVGDAPIIMGMQNGLENQKMLPKYFSKVVYCVISYNAWADAPGVIGYQKKGPLVIGTPDNSLQNELKAIAAIFNKGVETVVTDHFQDAAHSKLVINLTNSLTTLIGHKFREISDPALFQKLLTNLIWEGVQVVKAAGYKECKLGGMPPWANLWAGANLPRVITKGMFDKNVKKMVLSSMAQDILQRGGHDSELETINGYILQLAEINQVKVPFNKTIYRLCKERFSAAKFETMDVKEVWEEVQREI